MRRKKGMGENRRKKKGRKAGERGGRKGKEKKTDVSSARK